MLHPFRLLVLEALHKAGWVHGDVSSANVMLWHDQVKIGGFEFAKPFTRMLTADELENSSSRRIRTVSTLLDAHCPK